MDHALIVSLNQPSRIILSREGISPTENEESEYLLLVRRERR
jgi:hypothetical protein